VAELEARVNELTERLAVESKAPDESDEITTVRELKQVTLYKEKWRCVGVVAGVY